MSIPTAFAKLAGIRMVLGARLRDAQARYFDPAEVIPWFEATAVVLAELKDRIPQLYGDLAIREPPSIITSTDNEGRGHVHRHPIQNLLQDVDYILEVRSNSELAAPESPIEFRVFISHGSSPDWRTVQAFVEKDLKVPTLELAQEPNEGRTIYQKLIEEAGRCTYAVVVMTGDDVAPGGAPRARENVMHEIGYFQGRYGSGGVCLLHEEGASIPSNILGIAYIPFPKGMVEAALATLKREIDHARKRKMEGR